MKITYNWLKDFVDISLKPQALAERLTMAGLEVTALEKFEDDYVLEIEVTSNRPDWLSVIGIAREVAAITKSKIKNQKSKIQFKIQNFKKETTPFKINITDKDACPFYSARIIKDVKVKPSPAWLAKRLRAIGLRPVNNIVDITNYVLFTTGQPLHAFDLDKLKGRQIMVRFAKDGEELITIDGIKRKLKPGVLVIADEDKPAAIAGIMGGKESEVHAATRNILLESAYFSPVVTRKAGRLLGLSSDSSYRFERSVNRNSVVTSANQALTLILENAGAEAGPLYKSGTDKIAQAAVTLNCARVNKLSGYALSAPRIKSILKSLGFKAGSEKKGTLSFRVPDFRRDIKIEDDLLEELCRIHGYENMPLTLPAVKPSEIQEEAILLIQERIGGILTALGFNEVITYSLLSRKTLENAGLDKDNSISLENPLSIEQECLRPSILAGMLTALGRNLELQNKQCAFFEIGDCFNRISEYRSLGLLSNTMDLLELKGRLELLLQKLGIKDYKFSPSSRPIFQEAQSAALIVNEQELGIIGRFKKEILSAFKIDSQEVVACELNLDKLVPCAHFHKTYLGLPKYPLVSRDISLIVEERTSYQNIAETVRALRLDNLEAIRFKDLYRSESLGKGRKSITISLEFRSSSFTLTDAQVNSCMDTAIEHLCKELKAQIKKPPNDSLINVTGM